MRDTLSAWTPPCLWPPKRQKLTRFFASFSPRLVPTHKGLCRTQFCFDFFLQQQLLLLLTPQTDDDGFIHSTVRFGNCYCLVLFSPVLMESTNYSAARLCCHSTYSIFFMPEKLGRVGGRHGRRGRFNLDVALKSWLWNGTSSALPSLMRSSAL